MTYSEGLQYALKCAETGCGKDKRALRFTPSNNVAYFQYLTVPSVTISWGEPGTSYCLTFDFFIEEIVSKKKLFTMQGQFSSDEDGITWLRILHIQSHRSVDPCDEIEFWSFVSPSVRPTMDSVMAFLANAAIDEGRYSFDQMLLEAGVRSRGSSRSAEASVGLLEAVETEWSVLD